jgi:hypothetical protein
MNCRVSNEQDAWYHAALQLWDGVGILPGMLRKIYISAILCFGFAGLSVVSGQTHNAPSTDSTRTDRIQLVDPGISLGRPVFLLPLSLEERSAFLVPPFVPIGGYAGGKLPFLARPLSPDIDMLAPLHLQWEREAKLRPLYTVLAAVQIGGVAYIAYEHIRKRGLFK